MRQPPVKIWRCTVMIFTFALTACANIPSNTGPSVSPDLAWQARKSELGKFPSWRLNGRIAIKSLQDSWNANVFWQQHDSSFDIRFMTQLGRAVAQLQGHPGLATLHTSDQDLAATDVDELLHKRFGWTVPVEGLRYWVLGLTVPHLVEDKELDNQGRLVWLEQLGWHIDFVAYRKAGEVEIPRKILLEYPELHVRLIIDRWESVNDVATKRHNTPQSLMIDNAYNND